MSTKSFLLIIFLVLTCIFQMISCQPAEPLPGTTTGGTMGSDPTTGTTEPTTDTSNQTPGTDEGIVCVEHTYDTVETAAMALKDGLRTYTCSKCKHSYTETIPATKSIKVLAIGNSFTVDGTNHLWNIIKDGGAETVVIGNLYIGSCTLDKHWNNMKNDNASYKYYKNVEGEWTTTEDYKIIDALKQEKWDYIVLHQTSGSAGQASTFSNLDNIINYLNTNKTNPDAKIIWHMPWAYQGDSTHNEFPKYDNDQMKMYGEITARVKELILTRDTISAIIPSGTAVQNLRTSFVGDNVTRDGYHLNYGFGRYTASLTWYAVLTGGDIDVIDWIPAKYPDTVSYLPAIKDAVKSAMEKNFEITKSAFPQGVIPVGPQNPIDPSEVLNPEDFIAADTALAAAFGIDLSQYELLEWDYKTNSFWYCTSRVGTVTPGSSASTYHQNICTDRKYSVANELPAGTIFICDPGWRYRMEIYPTEDSVYKGTRPEGSTAPFYILTEDFLNGCTYIAWSVSSYPKSDISAIYHQAYAHVRVYVPIQK